MANAGLRIALLAKAGDARQQLQKALTDLGAELVCEADPSDIKPQALVDLNPSVVVVGLEPSLDKSLQPFDDVLSSTRFEVVYDDAEVSGQLSGWDLNRWARHLAAKLTGSDLMPPAPDGAKPLDALVELTPGAPETPAQMMADAKFEDYLGATTAMAVDIPASTDFSDALEREKGALSIEEAKPELDIDFDDLEKAMSPSSVADEIPAPANAELSPTDNALSGLVKDDFTDAITAASELNTVDDLGAFADFDFEALESDTAADTTPAISATEGKHATVDNDEAILDFSLDDESIFGPEVTNAQSAEMPAIAEDNALRFEDDLSTLADFEPNNDAISFSNYANEEESDANTLSIDDDVAALAAQLEANQDVTPAIAEVKDLEFENFQRENVASANVASTTSSSAAEPAKPKFDFSSLALADESAPIVNQAVVATSTASVLIEKTNLELEPTDEEKAAALAASGADPNAPVVASFGSSSKLVSETGAVLVLAGMGGPDAVRQLLKALPKEFSAPVLLYQHLEVGNHDRLVTQLEKISQLPVYLAVNGRAATPGQVAVLSSGIGIDFVSDQLQFGATDSQQTLVATMPPQHSAVVILSGAAVEAAQAAAYLQSNGGAAFAQDPGNCFEPAAANVLIEKGGKTAEIADIAKMLVSHFSK